MLAIILTVIVLAIMVAVLVGICRAAGDYDRWESANFQRLKDKDTDNG